MKMSISRLSKSLSMGTSSRMMMSTSIRMTMKMNIRMMKRMQMKNLDNFFDGSLRVCKRDLALDAQKLNKPERRK